MEQQITMNGDVQGPSSAETHLNDSNRVYLICLAIVAIAGAVGFIASTSIYYWSDKVSIESASRARQLNSALLIAQGKIAELNVSAANANERAGKAELEAQRLRLETDRVRSASQWRALPVESILSLMSKLRAASPGKIHVGWTIGDAESIWFGGQIMGLFQAAGWTVSGQAILLVTDISIGISIPEAPGTRNDQVRDIMSQAGFKVLNYDFPKGVMSFGTAPTTDEATMFIGVRENMINAAFFNLPFPPSTALPTWVRPPPGLKP